MWKRDKYNQVAHWPISLRGGTTCRLANEVHSKKADLPTKRDVLNIVRCSIPRTTPSIPLGALTALFFTWLYWFFRFWWFLCRTSLTNETLHGFAAWTGEHPHLHPHHLLRVGHRVHYSFIRIMIINLPVWSQQTGAGGRCSRSPCCLTCSGPRPGWKYHNMGRQAGSSILEKVEEGRGEIIGIKGSQ